MQEATHLRVFRDKYRERIIAGADYVHPERFMELIEAIIDDMEHNDKEID